MSICLECNKNFLSKDNRYAKFCCQSCAATYNNKKNPKRARTKKCKLCEVLILRGFTYCESCKESGKHLKHGKPFGEATLGEEIGRVNGTRPKCATYAGIREHARQIVKEREKKCQSCGYDKHVENAHIKAISDFPPDTKIAEINKPENLILLCPNCHWEFDNGLLKL